MTFLLRAAAALSLVIAAACQPVPQGGSCEANPSACAASNFIAVEMAKDIGTDFGGGLVLRNVQAAGTDVVVDLGVPIPAAPLEAVQKRAVHELLTQAFASGFCSDPEVEEVFDLGVLFQVRSFGADDALIGVSRLTSCGE